MRCGLCGKLTSQSTRNGRGSTDLPLPTFADKAANVSRADRQLVYIELSDWASGCFAPIPNSSMRYADEFDNAAESAGTVAAQPTRAGALATLRNKRRPTARVVPRSTRSPPTTSPNKNESHREDRRLHAEPRRGDQSSAAERRSSGKPSSGWPRSFNRQTSTSTTCGTTHRTKNVGSSWKS